jgi:hypothetical protein
MNKRQIGLVMISSLLLAACMKAYVPPNDAVFTISDVAGTYKPGKLKWEKALLDTNSFKGVDDSSSFTIYNYLSDSVFVSIDTKTSIYSKRYKLPLVNRSEDKVSVFYAFSWQETLPGYFLYKQDYILVVRLYYPSTGAKSYATIKNTSTRANNDSSIYVEKIDFTADKQ